jgi:hypothetical protein
VAPDGLDGTRLRFGLRDLERASLETPAPGIASAPGLAVSVQVFPADEKLPSLVECLESGVESPLASTLLAAARSEVGDHGLILTSVRAEVLRYKIGSRCVIAYYLQSGDGRCIVVVGKVYSDSAKALYLERNLERLHRHFLAAGPSIPRPLAVAGRLGLVLITAFLTEGEGGGGIAGRPPSTRLAPPWRPNFSRPCTATLARNDSIALRLAGETLAKLHSAPAERLELRLRDGAGEAAAVRERVARLAMAHPALGARLLQLGQQVAAELEDSHPAERVVAHGGFKRSQLVWSSDRVHVVDFDGLCLADPALDLGCFLAYLRPHRLYRGRRGYSEWFASAAAEFLGAYRQAAVATGRHSETSAGLLDRVRLYEASHLFKIATRRLNRLNSPRPAEISAICSEIAACVGQPWSRQ